MNAVLVYLLQFFSRLVDRLRDLIPNPVRLSIHWIGLGLVRLGLIDAERERRTTKLVWPRVITGLARMSKNAADVAMVGVAVGSGAIAGVGFAAPYWGLAFAIGSGFAAGTIALVSQRYSAESFDELNQAVRTSAFLVIVVTVPITVLFWVHSTALLSLLTSDTEAIAMGSAYLQIIGLGIPFAGLNLIGSRTFVGLDDAWTPMVLRAGGGVMNIGLNAIFIFVFGMGVVGAALGTVFANVAITITFAVALVAGRLPGVGTFPTQVDPFGSYIDRETIVDVVRIGVPVMGRSLVWTIAEFPLLAIVDIFGQDTVAAYVIARRIWGLMNTPGWGFGLASSSLVGQQLGTGNEELAEQYGREIVRFAVTVYILLAAIVFVFAEPIALLFTSDPSELSIPTTVALIRAACVAVVLHGVSGAAAGPLDASGDTQWTFYSQLFGMFGVAIPLAYLGAAGLTISSVVTIPPIGLWGLYLAFFAESAIPAALNYYRFMTGQWKEVSRDFRPSPTADDD